MILNIAGGPGRYPSLDGLRGIAIIAVLLRHAAYYWPQPLEGGLWNAWNNGWLGVNLFFALSGFLITQHLLAWWPQQKTWKFLSTYLLKRSLRIIPVYLTALSIVAFGAIPGYTPTQPITWKTTLQHLLFVQEYYRSPILIPLWSVAVEEKFYLLAPLITAFFLHSKRKNFIRTASIIFATCIIGKLLTIWLIPPSDYPQYFWTFRAPFQHAALNILIGSAIALITHKHPSINIKTSKQIQLSTALFTTLAIVLLAIDWLKTQQWITIEIVSLLFTIGCAFIIFLHTQANALPHPILGSLPLRFFAKISYPLYATHIMLIPLAITASESISTTQHIKFLCFFTTYTAASIALAALIHLIIERPFLRIKDRLRYPAPPDHSHLLPTTALH